MKSKQWSGYEESDISKPFSDERALIYVVRILKDIDHSTLSKHLLNCNYKIPLLEFRRLFRSQCGGGNCGWEGKNLCGVVLGVKGTMANARGERRRKI